MQCDEYSNEKDFLHPQTVYSSGVQKKGEGDGKITTRIHILYQTNKKAAESENTLFQDSLSAAFSLSAGDHKESPDTEII